MEILIKLKTILKTTLTNLSSSTRSLFHALGFSFAVSWKSSRKYFLLRILIEAAIAFQPISLVLLGKELLNLIVSASKQEMAGLLSRFGFLVLLLFAIQAGGAIFRKLNEVVSGVHRDLMAHYIDLEIIGKTSSLDLSFFDSPSFYDEILNTRRDSMALQTLSWFSLNLIHAAVQIGSTVFFLMALHPVFPLLIIALSIPAVIVEKRFIAHTYQWQWSFAPEERKMEYIKQIMTEKSYAREYRLFGLYPYMLDKYKKLWKLWFGQRKSLTVRKGRWAAILSLLPEAGQIVVLLYTFFRIVSAQLTVGDYALFTGLSAQLVGAVYLFTYALGQIADNQLRISNYRRFLSRKPLIDSTGSSIPGLQPVIEFKDVSFKYPGTESLILNNLSFSLRPGEKAALVGLNGAGKSTIVKLMLGFYQPDNGVILFDGKDIREYESDAVKRLFSVVFQDFCTYAFPVREAIGLAAIEKRLNEEQLEKACSLSGVDMLLKKWPAGIDTPITRQFEENGEELSGGESQKLALARAFFRDARIMILDEPSAALDPESEHMLFRQFHELCNGKSALFISHRLSSISMVDRILVLDGGRITECGSHDELTKLKGRYHYLFNLQAEKYRA